MLPIAITLLTAPPQQFSLKKLKISLRKNCLYQPISQASHGRLIWVIFSPRSLWLSLPPGFSSLMLCSAAALGSQNVAERTPWCCPVSTKDSLLPRATAWGCQGRWTPVSDLGAWAPTAPGGLTLTWGSRGGANTWFRTVSQCNGPVSRHEGLTSFSQALHAKYSQPNAADFQKRKELFS